jgi:hypothetical protein
LQAQSGVEGGCTTSFSVTATCSADRPKFLPFQVVLATHLQGEAKKYLCNHF